MANGYPRNYAYSCAEDGSVCMSYANLYEAYLNIWAEQEIAYQSLTKMFYVDEEAFNKLQNQLDNMPIRTECIQSSALLKGREKLATFIFQ